MLGLVLSLPFLLRRGESLQEGAEETLVILTVHNEAIYYEFEHGFKKWYFDKTGKTVKIDWRTPGGSQYAVKYADFIFENAFRLHWETILGKKWDIKVQEAYKNRINSRLESKNPLIKEVAEAFKNSNITAGIDLFFGGGKVDVVTQEKKGQIVQSGIFERHPEWFSNESIPEMFSGNELWDPNHCWVGTAISGFGIIFNRDVLQKLHYEGDLLNWEDLANQQLLGELALTDPSGSGVFTMAFEIILQQQMLWELNNLHEAGFSKSKETEETAVKLGWAKGMDVIQRIGANARYFSDKATEPVLDVSSGNCAAGISIDFYGLFQEQNLKIRSGSERFGFIMPKDGTVVSPDPISMFKGAPHPELALDFIEYVLSIDGQKLWDFRVGTPGGPKLYALNRSPIRKELYNPEYMKYRKNKSIDFYRDVSNFMYHPEWTGKLFKEIRFIIKAAFIDPHEELVAAWKAISVAKAQGRDEDANMALKIMSNLELINHENANGKIRNTLNSGDYIEEVQLLSRLSKYFSDQYDKARKVAEGKLVTAI